MAMTRGVGGSGRAYASPGTAIGRTLESAMDRAAARMPNGFSVTAFSGQRPYNPKTGTINHPSGWAIDASIKDPNNRTLPNIRDADSMRAYEAFAQETHRQLMQMVQDGVPGAQEALDRHEYGGYFGGRWTRDLMHQQVTPNVKPKMGSWETGATGDKVYEAKSKPFKTANWGLPGVDGQTMARSDVGFAPVGFNPIRTQDIQRVEGVDLVGKAPVADASSMFAGPFSNLAGGVFAQTPAKPFSDTPTALGGITGQENGDFRAAPIGPLSAKWTMDAGAGPSLPFSTPRPPSAVFSQPQRPISATPPTAYARAPQVPGYNALMSAVDHARPMPNLTDTAVGRLMANTPQISAPYNVMAGTPRAPVAPGFNPMQAAIDSAGPPQNPGLGGLLGTLGRAAMASPTRSTAAPAMGGYSPPAPQHSAPQAPTGLGGYSPPAPGPSRQSPSDPKSFNASWAAARDFGMANAAPPAPRAPAYNALMGAVDSAPRFTTQQVANPDYGPALAAYNAVKEQLANPATPVGYSLPGHAKPGEFGSAIQQMPQAPVAPPQLPSLPPQYIEKRVPVAPVMPARVRTPTPLAAYGQPPADPANFQAALGSALAGTSATSALGQALKSYGVGAAPTGTSWGMTSFGGAPTPIQNSAPEHIKIAASGPSIFGTAPRLPSYLGGNYLNSAGPTQGGHVTNLGGVMKGYDDSNAAFANVGNMLLGLMAGRGGGGASGFGGGARSSSEGGNLHG